MMITSLLDSSSKRMSKLTNSLNFSNESINGTALVAGKKLTVPKKTDSGLFDLFSNQKSQKDPRSSNLNPNYEMRLSKSDKDILIQAKNDIQSDAVPMYILSKSNKIYPSEFYDKSSNNNRLNFIKKFQQNELKSQRHLDSTNRNRSKNSSKESLENLNNIEKNLIKSTSLDRKEIKV